MTATALDTTTALVVVDLQKAVLAFPYSHPIEGVVANAERLVSAFREHGLPVIFTRVGGPPAVANRVDQPFTRPPGTMRPDAAESIIAPEPDEHVIVKRRWGAFTDTDLATHLSGLGVTQIVIVGVATGFGVESTARHAVELGLNVTLAIDAMTDMDPAIHENSVDRIFPRLGECASTDAILALVATGAG